MSVPRRGVVLAGGLGTRLFPATLAVSKQLLPVYDKPMIYYPLSTLMLAGHREVLIITAPRDLPLFEQLLGDGGQWGVKLSYAVQAEPRGIAQALTLAGPFLGGQACTLILGDNLFHGPDITRQLLAAQARPTGATIFASEVSDPGRYGVVSFGPGGAVTSLEEKPLRPASSYAVTGLYTYGPDAVDLAGSLPVSARGEFEITDLNRLYLERGELTVECLERGSVWMDAGTHDSLLEASSFVQAIERRQGVKLACPEEIALHHGWLSPDEVLLRAEQLGGPYAAYLRRVAQRQGASGGSI
ncbi:glucose-1-phosphate thymidylyltransferase RfbA [Deinococcus sedimenti]|uniref:Glucose-1-phosphate thymidylyltransferase n=1 Tax=Deinococcus sedimenti TaxID=1867090 RepID=A0ABQ2S6B6_9DEIO|nr:glucose-1-phosphate thymidylyltransferase RfbA [Deinococcus sedimenti]GGR93401.1 glucose-1-phosphate thymidylyltransferase [Deinococcus sedimenti]